MATEYGEHWEIPPPNEEHPRAKNEQAWPGGRWWWLDTDDPDHGARAMRRAYGVERLRVIQDDPFGLTVGAYRIEGMSLERTRSPGVVAELTTERATTVRVVKVLSGQLMVGPDHRVLGGAGPWLLPTVARTVRWADPDLLSISLDFGAVQEQAAAWLDREDFVLRFHSGAPFSAAMGQYLSRLMVTAWRDQLPNAQALTHRLVRARLAEQLVTAVLHTFPSTFLEHPSVPGQERPAHGAIRRSIAFMEEHLGEPLTVAQIAAAARMSPRGLQASFRREQGTTPMAHLRSLRLEAAHTQLLASDAATTTVAQIAARWGFTHPGRFAAAYRERYGCNPGATLGR